MTPDAGGALPERPPSVTEWEELLVRVDVMPRALRHTLDAVPADDPAALETLRALVAREDEVRRGLERAAYGEEPDAPTPEPGRGAAAGATWLVDRFASLRARNFAMMQRRGLGVWEWRIALRGEEPVSSYQLLGRLVGEDVRALAALRERAGSGSSAC